jgi:hypothetical protein
VQKSPEGWVSVMSDKVVVPGYWIPDTPQYSPVEIKGSPREYDERWRRYRNRGWLPKRVRTHPKMKRIFGKPKRVKPKKMRSQKSVSRVKTKTDEFNRLVEQVYKNHKL